MCGILLNRWCFALFSVYLYGAELWGPFVLHNEPSAVATHASAHITGLWRVRSIRRIGWLPWHDADIFAFCRACRALLEAVEREELLRFAVIQLVHNANCRSSAASSTWFGRLRRRVRVVWPGFDVSIVESNVDGESSETVIVSGIPENCLTTGDSAKFTSDQLFNVIHSF